MMGNLERIVIPSILILLAVASLPVISGEGNVMSCSTNGSSPVNCSSSPSMASIELICDDRKMQAGFNITELDNNILPYAIRFQGNNKCDVIRAQNSSQMNNGMIWIEAGLADCGINAYITDDEENIVFEQTIVVEYGSMTSNPLIYRYFNDTYKVKCSMDRNITQELNINVKERKTISTEINQTVSFDFDFEVTKKSDGQVVSGLVSIGEPLHFTLNVRSNLSTIKTSPQECFATRLDGTGVYDFIQDRCSNGDNTVKITSSPDDTHTFSWDMMAFRYFGNSDGVIIKCRVLICTDLDDSPGLSDPQCSRCGQLPLRRRKRRALNGNDDVRNVQAVVTSGPIFIIDSRAGGNSGNSGAVNNNAAEGQNILTQPEGIVLTSVVGVLLLSGMVIFVKKVLLTTAVGTAAAVGKSAAVSGIANPAVQA